MLVGEATSIDQHVVAFIESRAAQSLNSARYGFSLTGDVRIIRDPSKTIQNNPKQSKTANFANLVRLPQAAGFDEQKEGAEERRSDAAEKH